LEILAPAFHADRKLYDRAYRAAKPGFSARAAFAVRFTAQTA
jgi:hypothetical protein